MITGYLAPLEREELLKKELKGIVRQHGRLFLAEGDVQKVHWVQDIWQDVQEISFESIQDAANQLRALQGLWYFYPHQFVRRGELIREKLPRFEPKALKFPSSRPKTPLGSWTLLDEHTLLASKRSLSSFRGGEVYFVESEIPPSRAYLKLWEALTLAERIPQKGEACLEVGASPGSWTWALHELGLSVIAVDRAPLDPKIAALPGITFMKRDAFSLTPEEFPEIKWIFSDLVCYPEKLLSWVLKWIEKRPDINFICTLKFQGEGGYEVISEFEKRGAVMHLFHNKHELTWVRLV